MPDELGGLGLAERRERQVRDAPVARGAGQRGRERRRLDALARGDGDQHRAAGRPPHERGQRVDGAGVRPVDVVEPQHERPRAGEPLEQVAQGAVERVAVGRAGDAVERGERGQRRRQRARLGEAEQRQPAVAQLAQVRVQRLGPDGVRQVVLELRRRRAEHQAAGRRGALRQLGQQPRLADPRLAVDGHQLPGGAGAQPRERVVERLALTGASDQGGHGAGLSGRDR